MTQIFNAKNSSAIGILDQRRGKVLDMLRDDEMELVQLEERRTSLAERIQDQRYIIHDLDAAIETLSD